MSNVRWYARRTLDTLHYEGLPILLWRALAQCLSPFGTVQPWTFYRRDLTRPIAEMSAPAEITVTLAGESDVDQLATLVARRYGPSPIGPYEKRGIQGTIVHRLRRGLRCFVARVGLDIVHYNWLAFQREESLGDTAALIVLQVGEAYCSDAFTVERWRGKGIHTVVLRQMLVHAREVGCRTIYTDVGSDNKSSWKTHERLGWEVCGSALDFKARGTHRIWRWHLRGGPSAFATTSRTLVSFSGSDDPGGRGAESQPPR